MNLLGHTLQNDSINPPPRHWVSSFDKDDFLARMQLRIIKTQPAESRQAQLKRAYLKRRMA